ncbi:hypothetical protein ElyMa_001009800 [Elysia marginata]|uniref:Uncharacterized protein n=1 Tax=Elysia marginata TaxID=1093978 RepID=A0AAV4HMT8_9GAST|nr:hypothetical protein ElyMa_001009800 [Elysia marginata]
MRTEILGASVSDSHTLIHHDNIITTSGASTLHQQNRLCGLAVRTLAQRLDDTTTESTVLRTIAHLSSNIHACLSVTCKPQESQRNKTRLVYYISPLLPLGRHDDRTLCAALACLSVPFAS